MSTTTARSSMVRKVFIVDDHPVMLQGYAALIKRESDLEVAGEAASAEEALQKIDEVEPDLVIVDISLSGMNGIELIKHLTAQHEDLAILVVSMHDETLYGERALRAGAKGYVMKSEARTAVIEAIRTILKGDFYLSDPLNRKVLLRYTGQYEGETASVSSLSDRELEVFELIGQGNTTKEIADMLHLSEKTVHSHRSRIKRKLSIDNSIELTRQAVLWVQNR